MTDTSNDDRDTLPPSPETEPPPALSIMPSDTLKRMAGYDESQFLHVALAAAADGAHTSREDRKALIAAARTEFQDVVTAGYEMTRDAVIAKLEALLPRMAKVEQRLDSLDELRTEFAAMKVKMGEFEIALGLKTATT